MNEQDVINKIMRELGQMFPQGESAFKSEEQINGYRNHLHQGLSDNELLRPELIQLAFKKMRMRNSAFYPSVGEFVSACMPLPQDLNWFDPEEAYQKAVDCSHSSKRHKLDPLVYSACYGAWEALQDARKEKWWKERYIETFRNHYLHDVTLQNPPGMTKLIESKVLTDQDKSVGNKVLNDLRGDL